MQINFIEDMTTEEELNTIKGHMLCRTAIGEQAEIETAWRDAAGVLHIKYTDNKSWSIYGHNQTWRQDGLY